MFAVSIAPGIDPDLPFAQIEYVLWSLLAGVYIAPSRDFRTDGEFKTSVWALRLRLTWLMQTDERYELQRAVRQVMQEVQEHIHDVETPRER